MAFTKLNRKNLSITQINITFIVNESPSRTRKNQKLGSFSSDASLKNINSLLNALYFYQKQNVFVDYHIEKAYRCCFCGPVSTGVSGGFAHPDDLIKMIKKHFPKANREGQSGANLAMELVRGPLSKVIEEEPEA